MLLIFHHPTPIHGSTLQLQKNVHELSLWGIGSFDLPVSVFSCDSLRSLNLKLPRNNISDSEAFVVCLPRLESLVLPRVCFKSEGACEKRISGCPMLKYLDLSISNPDFKCTISSVSLRRLKISSLFKYSLKLKASSLEYLRLNGSIFEFFVEESLGSLVEVDFNLWLDGDDFSYNSIVEAIRAFDCVKVLTLSADAVQALKCATISLSTEFKRLVKLVVSNRCSLQDFIEISDNLEVLIISQDICHLDESYYDDHSKWNTLVEIPRYLSNSLKKIRLYSYAGLKDECEMIQFMLKHGSALETVEIISDGDIDDRDFELLQKRFKLLQEICELPRKSPACKVTFL